MLIRLKIARPKTMRIYNISSDDVNESRGPPGGGEIRSRRHAAAGDTDFGDSKANDRGRDEDNNTERLRLRFSY